MRELEREFKDLNRFEKEGLQIHQKGVASKPDRFGSIRDVKGIHQSKETAPLQHARADITIMLNEMRKRRSKKEEGNTNEDLRDAANKQKLNIFD